MSQVKKALRCLIPSFLALLLLSLVFTIFYLLSYLLTSTGSFLLFILLLYLATKVIIKVTTFPGSILFWRMSIERYYAAMTVHQLKHRIADLKSFLKFSQASSQSKNFLNLPSIIDKFQKVSQSLQMLQSQSLITRKQSQFLQVFSSLIKYLSNLMVTFSDTTMPLIDWCREQPCGIESISLTAESLSLNSDCLGAVEACLASPGEVFGTLDFMRADLMSKVTCEQVWLEMNDHVKIDW